MPKRQMTPTQMGELQEMWDEIKGMEDGPEKQAATDKFRQFHAFLAEQMDPPENVEGPLDWLGKNALDALDYTAGVVRTPVMAATALATGKGDKIREQDFEDALVPLDSRPAPDMREWRRRLGWEGGAWDKKLSDLPGPGVYAEPGQGGSLLRPEKGGRVDVTLGGLADFVGNAGLSPGGLAGGIQGLKGTLWKRPEAILEAEKVSARGISEALRADRLRALQDAEKGLVGRVRDNPIQAVLNVLHAPAKGVEKVGENAYRGVFREADRAARKAGVPQMPSKVMLRNKAWGGIDSLLEQREGILNRLGREEKEIASRVQRAEPLNRVPVPLVTQDRKKFLRSLVGDETNPGVPGKAAEAMQVERDIKKLYHDAGYNRENRTMTLPRAIETKQALQQRARDLRAYNPSTSPAPAQKQASSAMRKTLEGDAYRKDAQAIRSFVEDLADEVEPGAGGQIFLKNRDQSSLIASEEGFGKMLDASERRAAAAKSAGLGAAGGSIPGLIVGTAFGNPLLGAGVGAGVGALTSSPAVRTAIGLFMADHPELITNAARGAALTKFGEKVRAPSPWKLMELELYGETKDGKKGE